MDLGALYFDHRYPPDFGYGYVAASRFRTAAGIYLYGRIRRTDFLPVLAKRPDQRENFQRSRSALSDSDDDTMFAADTKSLDRFAAMHEQAADSAFEAAGLDIYDPSDVSSEDAQEEQLEEPAMAPEPLAGAAIGQEAELDGGAASDDELFVFEDCC